MGSLIAQGKIMAGPVLNALAPSLRRLGLFFVGVILGMILVYTVLPVKFHDAEPVHLASGYKDQWIKMTAVELAESGDTAEAQRKIVDAGVTPDMIQELVNANRASDPQLASQLEGLLVVANASQDAAAEQAKKIETGALGGILAPLACLLVIGVLGIIVAAVLTLVWVPPIGKWAKGAAPRPGAVSSGVGVSSSTQAARMAAQRASAEQKTDFAAVGEAPPISQYMSTYILGDDLYDDSFSIETPSGEFLGECGSGISETIGVGDPKKVTATEVWLFDKNDIRTVTKVLMSEHAFNDPALRTKLAPKGEAVLVTPGGVTILETQTLRVQVRIVDLQYGEGALPPHSFFERLTVELAAWPKEGAEGGKPASQPASSAAFGDTAELLNY